jgi:hypothetical protein
MSDMILWEAPNSQIVPASANTADAIVGCARQLPVRDKNQLLEAYKQGAFEMASSFIWLKAMATLKGQLSQLGMDFVGEMLARPDISDSSATEAITDYEAIRLAEDLGIISPLEGKRLRHSKDLIVHFSSPSQSAPSSEEGDESSAPDERMTVDEAVGCLRACVQNILGRPKIEVAVKFATFRRELETRTFPANDGQMVALAASPYMFKRTTLSVLLALAKSAQGATLENALGNINTILPLLWNQLRKPEKWQTGQTYAEVYAHGKNDSVAGLQRALLSVRGFDFVPETLRSNTFTAAATKVIEAHEGVNNFYNEPAPMGVLASLGSSIPWPAFPQCMTAVLSVKLGNPWGYCFAAGPYADRILKPLSTDRWKYYLIECLPGDRSILDKLTDDRPRSRWLGLVEEYNLSQYADGAPPKLAKLLVASKNKRSMDVAKAASELLSDLGYAH